MSIKQTPVRSLEERIICDKCNVEMEREGCVSLSDPPTYFYRCERCHDWEKSATCYPRIVHIPAPEIKLENQ